jgi:arginyl-tRNA synthetase
MKSELQTLLTAALDELKISRDVIAIERTKDPSHGDFASNVALVLAKGAGMQPRDLAARIVATIELIRERGELGAVGSHIARMDIAGPGFINFHVAEDAYRALVPEILRQGPDYGRAKLGAGRRVQVEFVSANPTGPLHVGHGRGAAYGAAVADLLEYVGFDVHREYYVNDAGRQMDILGTSVWLRYLELCGEALDFPSNGYKGDYVWDIAATLHREHGDAYRVDMDQVRVGLPPDEVAPGDGGDKEAHIDALIAQAKRLLGDNRWRYVFELGLNTILDDIRDDLAQFGITYQEWFSERSLTESGAVNRAVERLRAAGHLYEQAGALWFRSTAFGDEKDRVVVRENGQMTYFASDIAYHMDKLERGFERVIDIWGADHHGYVPRVKAALSALGDDPRRLDVLLVQFAVLYRGGEKVQMSTRSGDFVTLRELRKEVGPRRRALFLRHAPLRAAHGLRPGPGQEPVRRQPGLLRAIRPCARRQRAAAGRRARHRARGHADARDARLARLTEPHEISLLKTLARWPEAVETAALSEEPHQLTHYLRELANDFHTYYNAHQFLVDDAELRDARVQLILAVRVVLRTA